MHFPSSSRRFLKSAALSGRIQNFRLPAHYLQRRDPCLFLPSCHFPKFFERRNHFLPLAILRSFAQPILEPTAIRMSPSFVSVPLPGLKIHLCPLRTAMMRSASSEPILESPSALPVMAEFGPTTALVIDSSVCSSAWRITG